MNARKLLQPLRQYLGAYVDGGLYAYDRDIFIQCLKRAFNFLGEPDISGDDVRVKNVATMLRLSLFKTPLKGTHRQIWRFVTQFGRERERLYWRGHLDWHTPAQFDQLVNYLLLVCQGIDYDAICDAFVVLASLHGSPSTPDRKRIYIDTIIHFMGQAYPLAVRHAALFAVHVIGTEVASMGQVNDSFRDRFSQALASAVLSCDPAAERQVHNINPFNDHSYFNSGRDLRYLKLLYNLSQEPAWYSQLHRDGHFDSCLAIASTVSSQEGFGAYAAHVTPVLAIVAQSEEDHFGGAVQTYLTWPLIRKAWRYIFLFRFFAEGSKDSWESIPSKIYLEALPSIYAYAMQHKEEWDNTEETNKIIELVGEICYKLEEENCRNASPSPLPSTRDNSRPDDLYPTILGQYHGVERRSRSGSRGHQTMLNNDTERLSLESLTGLSTPMVLEESEVPGWSGEYHRPHIVEDRRDHHLSLENEQDGDGSYTEEGSRSFDRSQTHAPLSHARDGSKPDTNPPAISTPESLRTLDSREHPSLLRRSRSPSQRSRSPSQRSRSPSKRSRSPSQRSRSPPRRSRSPSRRPDHHRRSLSRSPSYRSILLRGRSRSHASEDHPQMPSKGRSRSFDRSDHPPRSSNRRSRFRSEGHPFVSPRGRRRSRWAQPYPMPTAPPEYGQHSSFGHLGIPDLGKQISGLLRSQEGDM